ncbi:uncharacterized protein CANTADRAFT_89757 [Suhomyces tanzawaensis NRRL Y-17324]|uniref:RING-type domain-containing protein n=1 Tax=Suhomyces tanzawaensis NRRL Y-17324 TaxID=984487 RepID=A0A1E4SL60_9ASCO|nr:uncharacterized protein CANTADRAFT_89757 [Suhomyces tanzawaensis NRRL Y-17324]ODV80177.1 hypothetical protein CANTADRAFT_89757 [Suhomyces tanzawaensis NRRL Y-17324]
MTDPSLFQLIHFDLAHLIHFATTNTKVPLRENAPKKRKFTARSDLAIDNLKYKDISSVSHDSSELEEEPSDLINFVDRTISFDNDSPVELEANLLQGLAQVAEGVYEIITDDIKLSYDQSEQLVFVKNKKVANISAKTLISINLFGLEGPKRESVKNEISILNMANLKLRKNGLSVVSPLMKITLNSKTNKINISIQYKIFTECDIYRVCQSDMLHKLHTIILGLIEDNVKITNIEPVTAKLFYTSISENTSRMPQCREEFDIPELETSLLGFQKKTLSWLLSKEHVKYDHSTNKCERIPLLDTETINMANAYLKNEQVEMGKLISKLSLTLDKLCFGWEKVRITIDPNSFYFYNRYTSNLITTREVCKYLKYYHETNDRQNYPLLLPSQGLLAEEMGLGKTVEITTLILMNQRPIEDINETIKVQLQPFGDLKTIIKAKTNLVIAPESILKQWVEEIIQLAPSLAVTIYHGVGNYPKLQNNPVLIAEYLRKFDVVFTTYSVISKELDYALYSSRNKSTRTRRVTYSENYEEESNMPLEEKKDNQQLLNDYQSFFQLALKSVKPKVANLKSSEDQQETDFEKALLDEINLAIIHNRIPEIYKSVDYESPLMLSQFWRVVLDEVQMVSSKISRAFQSASLIPRFHSWGVSGTPIKKNLQDLHSILQFLKVQPFCNEVGKFCWENLIKNSNDFIDLWTSISIRHTKAMTHDDIKLPPQSRVLLTIPFTAIEQDLYNQLLEECLATICLDVNGNPISNDWEPSSTILAYMRSWLLRLRQVCCNPQIGKLNIGSKKYRKSYSNSARGIGMIQKLKTLENLLDDMLTKAYNDVIDVEKQLYQLYLDLGEYHEFIYKPQVSLVFLNVGSKKTEKLIYRLKRILEKFIDSYKLQYLKILGDKIKYENDNEIGTIEASTNSSSIPRDDTMEKLEDKIRVLRIRIRNWNIVLHRFYFLIASAYFQRYDTEYGELIKKNGVSDNKTVLPQELKSLATDMEDDHLKDELASLVNNVKIDAFKLEQIDYTQNIKLEEYDIEGETEEEKNFKYLELKYYELAEQTRRDILLNSIDNVQKTVKARITSKGIYHKNVKHHFQDNGSLQLPKNTKSFFMKIPEIHVEGLSDFLITMSMKVFVDSLGKIITQLNLQTSTINEWMSDMIEILCKELLSHDKSPNGEEYEESIKDQDKVSSYLFVLGQVLSDRFQVLNGLESSVKLVTVKKVQEQREADLELQKVNDTEFLSNLQVIRENIKPTVKKSFQDVVLQIKELESELKESIGDDDEKRVNIQLELIEELGNKIRTIYENQKLALILLQKELNVNCNAVFNSRTDYFKQLQQISDSVKTSDFGMNREELDGTQVQRKLITYGQNCKVIRGKMDKSIAKFRYLRGLVGGDNSEEDSLMCSICRCTITIGSLTQCGHKYCKDCLEQWLKTVRNCPMCKSSISMDSVYNFTHHKPDLKVSKVEDHKVTPQGQAKNLHSIYKPISKETIDEIQQIKLIHSYSSKVDLIVKQVLHLRSRDPNVQIVIFSQWQDMLYILGTAFKASDISYLGSYGTLTPEVGIGRKPSKFDSVELFKDPKNGITCFLLNAKAQSSGLTLINATHIFLCEPLVNTSLELQAISRIHRIGQTKPTTVWMFVIENTVEESVVLTSTNKRLQYMENGGDNTNESSEEKKLSKAESITLMNSEGIDSMINKGTSRGETVTNSDIWNAFFSARTGLGVTDISISEKS